MMGNGLRDVKMVMESLSNQISFLLYRIVVPHEQMTVKHKKYYEIYTGQFIEDRFEGFGSYLFADGASYEGKWADNLRIGQGKFILPGE
jgi:hypothetical protein